MVLVGLTGRLGAGKSTLGRALEARGAELIDTDAVARGVLAPGSPGAREVARRFGHAVLREDGTLDRSALARVVFADPGQLSALEAITHPLVRREVRRRISQARSPVVVVEIPLLDRRRRREYGLDVVVYVHTPEDEAVRRAVGRGMDEADVRSRMAAQPSEAERRAVADRVVVNVAGRDALERQADELWAWLSGGLSGGPGRRSH